MQCPWLGSFRLCFFRDASANHADDVVHLTINASMPALNVMIDPQLPFLELSPAPIPKYGIDEDVVLESSVLVRRFPLAGTPVVLVRGCWAYSSTYAPRRFLVEPTSRPVLPDRLLGRTNDAGQVLPGDKQEQTALLHSEPAIPAERRANRHRQQGLTGIDMTAPATKSLAVRI